jgi:hypothetical protein
MPPDHSLERTQPRHANPLSIALAGGSALGRYADLCRQKGRVTHRLRTAPAHLVTHYRLRPVAPQIRAWAWLAAETDDLAEQKRCLEAIVALDPTLDWAQAALTRVWYRWRRESQEWLVWPAGEPRPRLPPPARSTGTECTGLGLAGVRWQTWQRGQGGGDTALTLLTNEPNRSPHQLLGISGAYRVWDKRTTT